MKTIIKTIAVAIVLLTLNLELGTWNCSANNLTLGSTITIASASQISFTIKWDNSWYVSASPSNWDAVWLFVKYKDCSTTDWKHAKLSTTGTDHTVTGGKGLLNIEIPAVNDGNGVFIRRKATGTGNIDSTETVTLKLNGITTGTYNFKVFGIEMVKVLKDSFEIGDGCGGYGFYSLRVTSENQTMNANSLWDNYSGGHPAVPAAFPKGYNAFYCMKYEITREQYADFLNTLTYDQQNARHGKTPNSMPGTSGAGDVIVTSTGVNNTTPATYGYNHNGNTTFNESSDGQNKAAGNISWADLAGFLDWACMRPMTELEFEKACRGPLSRNCGEYAWGSTFVTATGGYKNDGTSSETHGNAAGSMGVINASNGYSKVTRVGFAATATTDRMQSGATFYGAMEMSGNVRERIVNPTTNGVLYTGLLGDGVLDASGNANVSNWPGVNADGTGFRGGDWTYSPGQRHTISDRNQARDVDAGRAATYGGRGVR